MTKAIKEGDTIRVNYTGKFEGGEVFDSSEGRSPLKFVVGRGQLIAGFDRAVVGMKAGENKTVTIYPEDGYGEHREQLIIDIPKTDIPEEMKPEVGMRVELADQARNPIPAVVAEILDDVIRVDTNHPLSGETLVFDIEITETGIEPDPFQCGASCGGCGGSSGCG